MRHITTLLLCSLLFGCGVGTPTTPQERLQRATKELDAAGTPEQRFYALNDAAKESFVAGKTEEARKIG